MTLIKQCQQYLKEELAIHDHAKIVVAVSGGADSVCLLDILYKLNYSLAIAHCNFKLREHESDEDENFVKKLGIQYNLPVYTKTFDTEKYSKFHKISIQEAARELRYKFFESTCHHIHFNYIAVAHHADDNIETIFINLFRGTGIKGITGIPPKNNIIIRPLLFAFRNEIERYCYDNKLYFRTDSSNQSDKYLRNKIRHQLIPLCSNISPSFKQNMIENISKFKQAADIYQYFIKEKKRKITTSS